jgi:uncharacterized membrane protein
LSHGKKLLFKSNEKRVFRRKKTMTLESSKNMGGIGAILLFLGVLPWIAPYGWIIALAGLILALLGFKGLADYHREAGIFNNALYTVILAIVGAVVFVAILVTSALGLLASVGLEIANVSQWSTTLSDPNFWQSHMNLLWTFLGQVIIGFVVLWVCLIIAAVFLRKSLGLASLKTGVGMFGTTGMLILIGAIIPLIGLILVWIGLLLLAVAFFQVRPVAQQPTQPTAPT